MSDKHNDTIFGALPLKQFNFDLIEIPVLEVLRNFCLQFAGPSSGGQRRAFKRAARDLGKIADQKYNISLS